MRRKILLALAFVAGMAIADQQVGAGYVYGANDPRDMGNAAVQDVLGGFNPIGPLQYVVISNPQSGIGVQYRYSEMNDSWYQGTSNNGGGSAACGGSMQRPCPQPNGSGNITI